MLHIERHITPDDLTKALHADVRTGLTARLKTLPPKWFYDARGSELFERITTLDEYYPTRAERAILLDKAGEIAAATGAGTLLELGSGSAEKTRLLLDALADAGTLRRYVPVDVSESALVEAAGRITVAFPAIDVHGVVDDFENTVGALPSRSESEGGRLVAVLGGTIGNFTPQERTALLSELRAGLAPGDTVLLGTDLVKGRHRLIAAYDDAVGVTAEFNRNVLHVINRELGADFAPEMFDHVAVWEPQAERIEMRLRSKARQTASIPALDLTVEFAAGEDVRTEISCKFRRDMLAGELASAGFTLRHWWIDPAGDFALSLAVPEP